MAKKSLRSVLLIVLFCAYIGAFSILYIVLPKQDFSENEKRVLAKFPEASFAAITDGSFESGFETWLSDHVPGRDALVGVNALYEQASGRNGLGGVIRSKDGRLFAAPEKMDAASAAGKCARINALAESTGLPADVMIIPTVGYMNQDQLPALHGRYNDSELAALVREELNADIGFIWPEDHFRSLTDAQLYYNTDHHLTSRGSYEAYSLYAQHLGLTPPAADNYSIETVPGFYGSMYAKAGLWNTEADSLEIWRSNSLQNVTVGFDDRESANSLFFTDHLSSMDKYPVFLDGNHGLVTIETGNEEGENLLIVRDSFGHCFAPFAADNFKRVVLVDLRYFRRPVSQLAAEMEIDRLLVLYGTDTFLTDTNFVWLK